MNILLGVTGSIATYKACELVRQFQERGCTVKVILTDSAQQFVSKLTFESITNDTVYTNMFGTDVSGNIHIDLARWADAFVVAPATANIISKFAYGLADDFLSTVYLAFDGMCFIAPAMNTKMWEESSVQANVQTLKNKKNIFLDPKDGELACKEIGIGKMDEPENICEFVIGTFRNHSKLQDKNILITAGPTREYFDPVRFLSSPSSGRMGLAIANEAKKRGATVTLVRGPMQVPDSFSGKDIPVISAKEMMERVREHLPCDIFVSCAAVSDYRFDEVLASKFKKGQHEVTLKLVPNPDILQYVSKEKLYKDLVIGFAAETHDVKQNALKKLREKNLNWVVANQVYQERQGFEREQTSVLMLNAKDEHEFKNISKTEFSKKFWDIIESSFSPS